MMMSGLVRRGGEGGRRGRQGAQQCRNITAGMLDSLIAVSLCRIDIQPNQHNEIVSGGQHQDWKVSCRPSSCTAHGVLFPGLHTEVHVDRAGLGAVLRRVVRVTAGRPVRSLESLHAALAGVVARYTLTADRRDLVPVRACGRRAERNEHGPPTRGVYN